MKSIVSVESTQLVNQVVNNELVKALQKASSKVFLEEIDETNAKDLVSLGIVPSRGRFKVKAVLNGDHDETEETTHKCEIILVDGLELWDELVLRFNKLW